MKTNINLTSNVVLLERGEFFVGNRQLRSSFVAVRFGELLLEI